ncbi:hypothetical protein SAMN04487918_1011873 [Bacillus sp. bc15]|uniref:hypothetical protein n=1 Tax=Bacillus sp. bc15 TaxID=1761758 RepID=UPI0009166D8B|nr:hypothetical protein [Bacillus sp. bc15]SHL25161.1 hypothetical protein SAMN04487918_1011873 [Bacillus sp. bc15]
MDAILISCDEIILGMQADIVVIDMLLLVMTKYKYNVDTIVTGKPLQILPWRT